MRKLHLKISVFTSYFPLKVQGSFKILSSACSILWKYCIFANNFCKWRQIHVKTLISVCPTMYFQRAQHQWTHTWNKQCSHLNIMQILPCKPLSKPEHTARYGPVSIYQTFYFESMLQSKIYASFWWEHPQLLKYTACWTQYFEGILHFQRQMLVKRCKLYM